jgi:hypothetical protein
MEFIWIVIMLVVAIMLKGVVVYLWIKHRKALDYVGFEIDEDGAGVRIDLSWGSDWIRLYDPDDDMFYFVTIIGGKVTVNGLLPPNKMLVEYKPDKVHIRWPESWVTAYGRCLPECGKYLDMKNEDVWVRFEARSDGAVSISTWEGEQEVENWQVGVPSQFRHLDLSFFLLKKDDVICVYTSKDVRWL